MIGDMQGFNDTEIKLKLANVQKIWQRFLYRDSVLLEAERQKASLGHVDDWAVEFLKLAEDDVSTTLMQVYLSCFVKTHLRIFFSLAEGRKTQYLLNIGLATKLE